MPEAQNQPVDAGLDNAKQALEENKESSIQDFESVKQGVLHGIEKDKSEISKLLQGLEENPEALQEWETFVQNDLPKHIAEIEALQKSEDEGVLSGLKVAIEQLEASWQTHQAVAQESSHGLYVKSEKYLENTAKFNEQIDAGLEKKPIMVALFKMISKMIGKDFDELIREPGFIGDIARGFFEMKEVEGSPVMSEDLKNNLKKMINTENGEPLSNTIDGSASNDPQVANMLADLGKRFSDSTKGETISVVDSKTYGISSQDQKNAGKTAGVATLQVSNANQAAAVILFAQKRSKDLGKALNERIQMDGELGQALKGSLKDLTSSDVNKYAQTYQKGYPDNVTARYKGGSKNGGHYVQVRWYTDGVLEQNEDDTDEESPQTETNETK